MRNSVLVSRKADKKPAKFIPIMEPVQMAKLIGNSALVQFHLPIIQMEKVTWKDFANWVKVNGYRVEQGAKHPKLIIGTSSIAVPSHNNQDFVPDYFLKEVAAALGIEKAELLEQI